MNIDLLLVIAAICFIVLTGAWLFFDLRKHPTKTDVRYVDWLGRRRRRIRYGDTGKVVKQVRRRNWRGRQVKETYVTKKCFR